MPDSTETLQETAEDTGPDVERGVPAPRRAQVWVILASALIGILLLAFPASRQAVWQAIGLASHADIPAVKRYLLQFGVYAPLLSILLMVLHALLVPIPAPLIALVNGLVFGPWWGTVITWTGSMIGASLAFAISRAAGRGPLLRILGASRVARYDTWIARRGFQAILIARLIPLISFDLISFVAGFTAISFPSFFVGTALGILPATIAWNIVGDRFGNGPSGTLFAIIGVMTLGLLVPFGARLVMNRYVKKPQRKN